MEDFIAVIIGVVFIASSFVRIIKKFSENGNNNKRKEITQKLSDFLSDKSEQREPQVANPREHSGYNTQKQSYDDEWIPAYEGVPVNDDRPLEKVSDKNPSINLDRAELEKKLNEKRKSPNQLILDDEITIRDGNIVNNDRNKRNELGQEKAGRKDVYQNYDESRKSYFDEDSFNDEDLIKGVIFKEILDEPRAKKPYKPFDRIR